MMRWFLGTLIMGIMMTNIPAFSESGDADLPALLSIWDYNDPTGSRARFEELRPKAEASGDTEYYLSLLTQIGRTYGLDGQYEQAHALLDTVQEQLTDHMPVARVNYLLERGRTYRSGGDPAKSAPLFTEAYELARKTGQDYLAIDAAHMMALVAETPEARMDWSQRGLKLARESSDTRTINWVGSISNNIGWDYHDRGQYDSAFAAFQEALYARVKQGDPGRLRIAKWCVARCLRSLDRVDEALAMQVALDQELRDNDDRDGYVFEELGELYLLKGDSAKAAQNFREAYTDLSQDRWFVENESERLQRIKELGKVK